MTFKKNLISLGRGRVSSACQTENEVVFVQKNDGRLTKKLMPAGQGQVYGARVAGYGDDLWLMPGYRLERINEELIIVKDQLEATEASCKTQQTQAGIL